MEAEAITAMVCSRGNTHTIQFKPMTTSNITATNTTSTVDRHLIRTTATGIAIALAPLAAVIGIAAMNVPAAEATTICNRVHNTVICNSY